MVWVACGGGGAQGLCCGAPGTKVQTAGALVAQPPPGGRAQSSRRARDRRTLQLAGTVSDSRLVQQGT